MPPVTDRPPLQLTQVREYSEFSVAWTRRDRAVAASGVPIQQPSLPAAGGFQALASYVLGGRNAEEEKMAPRPRCSHPPAPRGTLS